MNDFSWFQSAVPVTRRWSEPFSSFLAVAAAMYYTRRIDWYSSLASNMAGAPPLDEA